MGGEIATVDVPEAASLPKTSFVSQRINGSTFLIIEDDAFDEQPYIYVKTYPNYILITDTGCNAPRQQGQSITSLRDFIEKYPLPINEGQPLNPDGKRKYLIICSHCHYDHVLGLPEFSSANPKIIASSFEPKFLLEDLPTHSLCRFLNVPTPEYCISNWVSHMGYFVSDKIPFRIQFLQVPGHTPDALAWYDIDEHQLYVGDTFYERRPNISIPGLPGHDGKPCRPPAAGAIIFPNEGGDWIQYMSSLELLLSFVLFRNAELKRQYEGTQRLSPRVKVGCGHLTHSADAEEMIQEVQALFERIIAGKVPVNETMIVRGAVTDFWLESDDARYSVKAPRRLVEEARQHLRTGLSRE